ncbi:MAG TPA: NADH-quinone oxidoreductase subunit NuoH [Blastocatellia bacterium]|jgi:NADH-quinone oxidoreductase subunit H|nr:NADH-quinone oxidoreductase subunit NuoH [Blastocatellia bacterium]
MTELLLEWVIKISVIIFLLLTAVAYVTLFERKVMSWIQLRVGPNRVGPWGLLQPAADGLKFIFKEDIVPLQANKWLYIVAPAISLIPALMVLIVIPYGSTITVAGRAIDLFVTNINIGLLYILGLTSLGVYGIVLAGWSSNNKYSLIGGLRSSAQMVSYELALGMSIIGALLMSGTLDLVGIVQSQSGYWWGFIPRWNIFLQPLGFIIFFISSLAETNRVPFDLPEAEGELVAGYHTEYSSMKFAMFYMAEYVNLITAAAVGVTLFFGGWNGPGVERFPWLSIIYFLIKVAITIFVYMWIRFSLPRFRYDQLMVFGWKFLLPLALLNIIVTATLMMIFWT